MRSDVIVEGTLDSESRRLLFQIMNSMYLIEVVECILDLLMIIFCSLWEDGGLFILDLISPFHSNTYFRKSSSEFLQMYSHLLTVRQ
jgi:hypothetical protein